MISCQPGFLLVGIISSCRPENIYCITAKRTDVRSVNHITRNQYHIIFCHTLLAIEKYLITTTPQYQHHLFFGMYMAIKECPRFHRKKTYLCILTGNEP